jgi:hypothetical protein
MAAVIALLAGPLLAPGPLLVPGARAQQQGSGEREAPDLGRLYQRARIQSLTQARLDEHAAPLSPVRLRTPRLDSLRARFGRRQARDGADAPASPLPPIRTRRAVQRLARAAFTERFAGTDWAYLGANGRTLLDTMQTRRLRARLQALYGDPTLTVVDAESLDGRPAPQYIQFAYWLVVNDSIPAKVVDTGGPFDRGLVFAAPARFRNRLRTLREAVLAPLAETDLRARYVDYYFETSTATWYRTGFDGKRFFARPVERREIRAGQRPVLERDS